MEKGAPAPEFTLTAADGSEVSLSDFRGQKVVIYFYPKADTPGCTRQACSVRDVYPALRDDAVVIGISPDSPLALTAFQEKYDLPFILLSDPDHRVAEKYDAWGEKMIFGKKREGIIRSHFTVDEEGRLTEAEYNVEPEATSHLATEWFKY